MTKIIAVLLMSFLVASPGWAQDENTDMREFVMSCTYGVLAGTLVGAATLAFTENPGDNLRNLARGASIGLYVGILLGLYVVYIVPGGDDPEEEELEEARMPKFQLYPILSQRQDKIEGVQAQIKLLSF